MEARTILYVLLAILSFDFIYSKILEYLNIKSMREELPDEVSDIYDEEKGVAFVELFVMIILFKLFNSAVGAGINAQSAAVAKVWVNFNFIVYQVKRRAAGGIQTDITIDA